MSTTAINVSQGQWGLRIRDPCSPMSVTRLRADKESGAEAVQLFSEDTWINHR